VSKASRPHVSRTVLALGAGLLLAPAAHAQMQQPLQQPHAQQQQPHQQAPDLQQIWQMQKMQMRARVAGAIQQLRNACGEELRNFCSTVTPGEARLLLCMQAHEDKISRQCELALLETTRSIGSAVRKVENLAQACWQDIQTHCSGTGGSVVQCMIEKRASLSPQCQAIVAASAPPAAQQGQAQGQTPQGGQMTMVGLPIYSADGMMLGQVTGLRRRSDGGLEAIEADVGTPLGLGATSVLISPGELRWRGDGVELQMMADQVRSVLQGQQQRR
jgi:hypothetical protein